MWGLGWVVLSRTPVAGYLVSFYAQVETPYRSMSYWELHKARDMCHESITRHGHEGEPCLVHRAHHEMIPGVARRRRLLLLTICISGSPFFQDIALTALPQLSVRGVLKIYMTVQSCWYECGWTSHTHNCYRTFASSIEFFVSSTIGHCQASSVIKTSAYTAYNLDFWGSNG